MRAWSGATGEAYQRCHGSTKVTGVRASLSDVIFTRTYPASLVNLQMKTSRFCILALLLFLVGCRGPKVPISDKYTGEENPEPPEISVNSVGRGHLQGPGDIDIYGGTCFLLEGKESPLIVGAYHVLGSVSSESKLTLASKIPDLATAKGDPVAVASQGNAGFSTTLEDCYARGDLAAYVTDEVNEKAQVLEVAQTDAKPKEPVWVVELQGKKSNIAGCRLAAGTVAYHSNHALVIKMKDVTSVQATSGAPVVNAQGKVVGVNVGFVQNSDGYFRVAVPGEAVRALVD